MKKIVVFASGEGSNFQALLDACGERRIDGEIVLLVSSKALAGALKRAREANIESLVLNPSDFKNPADYDARLTLECKKRRADLIVLAGFMIRIGEKLLRAFPSKIMNVHPALLPAFGGKGFYGLKVHEAVLKSGAKVSGCTIHLIDKDYDQGALLLQEAVPVLNSDDARSLAERVLNLEHRLYPEAVRLFCEGRFEIKGARARFLPAPNGARKKRALISVSDKTGVVEFARNLLALGFEIVSSSGTARLLKENKIPVVFIEEVTGFPEILSGRVKTLHPLVHGGILMRRKNPGDRKDARERSIEPVDLVCVNLYPFSKTAEKSDSPFKPEVLDQIDIGGVALIRAAAKNFEEVLVVVAPSDYAEVLQNLSASKGVLELDFRKRLALKAFELTAAYDAAISKAFQSAFLAKACRSAYGNGVAIRPKLISSSDPELFPQEMSLTLTKVQSLRYGENPHQKAALYSRAGAAPSYEQIFGKELSYNNLMDAQAAWECALDFKEPACAIFKHSTPSGVANAENLTTAFDLAWESDPLSAFGGILAFNRTFSAAIAEKLSRRFVEVVIAPDFDPGALALLKKKQNLRVIRREKEAAPPLQWHSAGADFLVSEPDGVVFGPEWKIVTRRKPDPKEEKALRFAWAVCKHVKSNAIALTGLNFTAGLGAGQMSRVDSVHLAGVKYKMWLRSHPAPSPLVLASDAFFPFADGIEAAMSLGASAIIQPGGSVRDAEVIAAADQKNVAMVFTGLRHFRH